MARRAKSLDTLVKQVDTAYPNRSKASDGWLGDAAHQAVASDHNPNSLGVVTAQDLTHDPIHGFDAHKVADNLRTNRHPDLKYIISNRRIAGAWSNWQWQNYTGSNPHDKHIHISVGRGDDGESTPPYDDTNLWNIKGDTMDYPNQGDLVNFHNRTGWPGHPINDNDVAYWTKGTSNPYWKEGDTQVWRQLIKSVTEYVANESPTSPSATVLDKGLYEVR